MFHFDSKIKRIQTTCIALFLFPILIHAQSIGIGTTSPNNSAILDISSTNKGILIPRMTTPQRDAIVSPVDGLQVYNTDDGCLEVRSENSWKKNCIYKLSDSITIQANFWLPLNDIPFSVSHSGSRTFTIGDQAYILTNNQSWQYNTVNDTWVQKASFPGASRSSAIAFSIGSFGYYGLGSNQIDFWRYNPNTNFWTQLTNFPGAVRVEAFSGSTQYRGYVGGGRLNTTNSMTYSDFWEYNPNTNLWNQKQSLPQQKFGASTFVLDNKLYIIGGARSLPPNYNNVVASSNCFMFSSDTTGVTGTWFAKADLVDARIFCTALSTNDNGYVGFGATLTEFGNGSYSFNKNDFWKYTKGVNNNDLGSWTEAKSLSSYVWIGFSVQNKIYVAGSIVGNGTYNLYRYITSPMDLPQVKQVLPNNGIVANNADWTLIGGKLKTTSQNIQTEVNGAFMVNVKDKVAFSDSDNVSIGKINFSNINLDLGIYGEKSGSNSGLTNRFALGIDADYVHLATGFVTSDVSPAFSIDKNKNVRIYGNKTFEFGSGVSGKENHAGKIGYQTFSSNGLDIIGAGLTYPNRNVRIFDRLYFENILANRKIILWESANNDHQFYGFGVESGTLRYQSSGIHRFYSGTSATTSNLLMTIFENGSTVITGPMCATAYNTCSDVTLKKNILPLTASITNLLALQGYTYQWKDEKQDSAIQSGFLAQEVEKLFPHLVKKDEKGLLSVNYTGLIPYLVESLKTLKAENENIHQKNITLETKLTSIETSYQEILLKIKQLENKK